MFQKIQEQVEVIGAVLKAALKQSVTTPDNVVLYSRSQWDMSGLFQHIEYLAKLKRFWIRV